MIKKLDYRCLGNYCQQASHCRRHTRPEKGQIIPLAAFDVRDKPEGRHVDIDRSASDDAASGRKRLCSDAEARGAWR